MIRAYGFQMEIWAFIRMMQALDDKVAHAPNQGKGAAMGNFFERYEDQYLDLQAKLVDAAQFNFNRYARLYLDEKISLVPQNPNEWRLCQQFIQQILQDINNRLTIIPSDSEEYSLIMERDYLTELLHDMAKRI